MMNSPRSFSVSVLYLLLGTAAVLSVPLLAMQFTPEVNWSGSDFALMALLVVGLGMAWLIFTRSEQNGLYRWGWAAAVGSTFLLVWANLAVGLMGSGPNAGNLLYIGVLAAAIAGIYRFGLTPGGMARVMTVTAGSLVVVAGIALLSGMQHYPGSSATKIVVVNALFFVLFAATAFLFRMSARRVLAR